MIKQTMIKRTKYLYAVLAGLFCLLLGACSREPVSAKSVDPSEVKVEAARDPNTVDFDQADRFHLVTAEQRRFTQTLDANGAVAPDVSRTVPVAVLSSGRVIEVRARLGDDVQKGQVLLTMTSPDLSQAISEYQKFLTDARLAKMQLDRARLLVSRGAMAQKELEIAQDAFDKSQVDTRTAAERIRIIGGDLQHLTAVIEVTAPTSGTIVEQNVTAAAGVKSLDNSPNLFTIADLSNVWVLCDVYENNLAQVHVGDRAEIELNAYQGRRFQGRIANISKLLDPNTRAAKVRIEFTNEKGLLRPNMFATVHFISQETETRTVIPASAVLRLQDRDWVFVKLNDKQFRRTEVQAGPVNSDTTQQVLSGLRSGDQVVSDALMFDREIQKGSQQ